MLDPISGLFRYPYPHSKLVCVTLSNAPNHTSDIGFVCLCDWPMLILTISLLLILITCRSSQWLGRVNSNRHWIGLYLTDSKSWSENVDVRTVHMLFRSKWCGTVLNPAIGRIQECDTSSSLIVWASPQAILFSVDKQNVALCLCITNKQTLLAGL